MIGNFFDGIHGTIAAEDAVATGNFVGTDPSGTTVESNARGIWFRGNGGRIGGSLPAERNLVSGNSTVGVVVSGEDIVVLGNYVGTDAAGMTALANGDGVAAAGARARIGAAGAGNLLSGNIQAGVAITGRLETFVFGNLIGTDATGTGPLGNATGVWAAAVPGSSSLNSEIGDPTAGNVIAFNTEDGVLIGPPCSMCTTPQAGHRVSGNSIFGNGGLGIDLLGVDGVDVVAGGDPLDADTGPNGLQNRPVLLSADEVGASAEIEWSLDSAASTTYRVEFFSSQACDASGAGEGELYLGHVEATTDAAGTVTVLSSMPSPGTSGVIVATAIDLGTNDTSEFSDCVSFAAAGSPIAIPTLSAWGAILLALSLGFFAFRRMRIAA